MNPRLIGLFALFLALLAPLPGGAGEPKVLRMVLGSDPPQLSSLKATDQVSGFVLGHLMEGLTRYGRNSEIVPGIAEKWQMDDHRARFELRKDAKWADGRPVTAHDFVFAWRTVVDPKTASEYAFVLVPVKNAAAISAGKLPTTTLGVSAVDDFTLAVELEAPCGYFLSLTAFPTYMPVREDFYVKKPDRYGADAEDILSNGPFKLTSWVHGASLVMDKNPEYWNKGQIQLDRIEIPYITNDPSAAYNLFIDGKVDLLGDMTGIGKDSLDRAQADRLKMKAFSTGSAWFLEFNQRPGQVTVNWNLRKAIQLAFDPKEFVSKVVGIPGTRPGASFIPYWVPGANGRFHAEYPLTPTPTNVAEAKRHLERAKAELGGALPELVFLTGDTPAAARYAEYFQFIFKTRLGLELRIDRQIFKQRLEKMRAGQFDIVQAGWGPDYPDAMTFVDLFASWNDNNHGKYQNAKYDELVRRAQSTSDPKIRMEAMAEAERLALSEVAMLPTHETAIVYAHNPRVSGIVRHVVGPDPDFTFATLLE